MKWLKLIGSFAWTSLRVVVGGVGSLVSHLGLTVTEAKLNYALALEQFKGVAK